MSDKNEQFNTKSTLTGSGDQSESGTSTDPKKEGYVMIKNPHAEPVVGDGFCISDGDFRSYVEILIKKTGQEIVVAGRDFVIMTGDDDVLEVCQSRENDVFTYESVTQETVDQYKESEQSIYEPLSVEPTEEVCAL